MLARLDDIFWVLLMLKALLFGSIGTICDTSDLQRRAFNEAFEEQSLDWHWTEDKYRQLLGITGGRERIRRYSQEQGGEVLGDKLIAQLHTRKTEAFTTMLASGEARIRPGVQRLMDAARERDLWMGFVTSTERTTLEGIDAAFGTAFSLTDFDVVTDRSLLRHTKPDPECYRIALSSLGVSAAQAVAIEDTEACVQAAVNAGVGCIATPHSFSDQQDFGAAVACVSHLGDVSEPAQQVSGEPVLTDGAVTLDSLDALVVASAAA